MDETAAGWCVNSDDAAAVQSVLAEMHALGGKYLALETGKRFVDTSVHASLQKMRS